MAFRISPMKAPNARQCRRKQGSSRGNSRPVRSRTGAPVATLCANENDAASACGQGDPRLSHRAGRGRELIDGIASWWTACHGYNHPHIRAAVERQLASLPHVMFGGLVHEQALMLARRLAGMLGRDDLNRVFFSESGSVAVEVALKMALQYWRNRGVSGRNRFIAFKHGYHGDTTGAMSVSDPRNG